MRGGLASFMQLQSNIGVAFVNALNISQAMHWTKISWSCMVVPGNDICCTCLKFEVVFKCNYNYVSTYNILLSINSYNLNEKLFWQLDYFRYRNLHITL